jgi:phage-related protein
MPSPSIMVRVLGDVSNLSKSFKDAEGSASKAHSEIQANNEKTGSSLRRLGTAVAAGFAVDKVIDFGREAVTAASDLNESQSKIGVVFGKSAQSVLDWSKNSATAMGLSQQAALEAAGTYGNLAVSLGLPVATAAKMSTSLTQLAGDLASFNNVDPKEALEALRSGLTGETEPLKRFGVNLNQASIEYEALRLGLVKAPRDLDKINAAHSRLSIAQRAASEATKKYGKDSIQAMKANLGVESAQNGLEKAMKGGAVQVDASAKAQASYSLIMKQTATAHGDFARTSNGLANQQRIMKAQMENVKATVGQALLPVIVKLAGVFTKDLVPIIRVAATFFKENAGWIVPLVAVLGSLIAITKVFTAVQLALNVVMDANPFVLIGLAIAALIAGIVYLATKTQFFQTIWKGITDAFAATWNWVKTNWPLLLAIITGPIGLAILWIIKNWKKVTDLFAAAWDWLQKTWSTVSGFITAPFKAAFDWLDKTVHQIADAFTVAYNWLLKTWKSVTGFITAPISAAFNWLSNAVGSVTKAFGTIIGWLTTGWTVVTNFITKPISAAWDWISNSIATVVGWFTGIPDRIRTGLGRIVDVLTGPFKAAFNAIARLWNSTVGSLSFKVPGWVPGLGGKGFDVPNIPTLAQGGLITSTGLVFAHAGEVISPAPAGSTGPAVVINNAHFANELDVEAFMRKAAWIARAARV